MRVLIALFTVVTVCVASSPQAVSIPLYQLRNPLRHLILNAHKPQYQTLISKLEKLRASNNTVPLFKFLDNEIYGKVLIGHPGKEFTVNFDTSWSDLWVPSIYCSDTACENKNRFDGSKSSTYNMTDQTYKVNFSGNDSIEGKVSIEHMVIGQLGLANQSFAEVYHLPYKEFGLTKVDGIFGLGFSALASKGIVPFTYNLVKQGLIAKQIFSLYINRDPATSKGGTLLLGDIDKKHYTGDLDYLNIIDDSSGLWKFNLQNMTLKHRGSINDTTFCESGCTAFIDSSATYFRGPATIVEKINQLIRARPASLGMYSVDCTTVKNLPHFQIVINNKVYDLKGTDYIMKMSNETATVCLSCFTIFENGAANWTFGGAFLAKFYSVYDMEKRQIGFAPTRM